MSQNQTVTVSDRPSRERAAWDALPHDDAVDGNSDVRALASSCADLLVDGRYQLLRYVASGGMGSVWEALDVRRETRVALKMMTSANGRAESKERFLREITLASGLVGRHFPRVFGYGLHAGAPYLALELIEGDTLAARLQDRGRLALEDCRWLARELCEALGQAHDFGVVHRDITPKNLMIVGAVGAEELKVLDLGIARHALFDRKLTQPGTLVGSPRYMSPEQIGNGSVDGRSDLWSAAVVLYRALVGRHPFPGEEMEALEAALSQPAIPPSSVVPELGPAVDRFFEIALSKNVAGRFASATRLWTMFDAALEAPADAGAPVRVAADDRPAPPVDADTVVEGSAVAPCEAIAAERLAEDVPGLTNIKTRQLVRRDSVASAPSIAAGPLTAPVAMAAAPSPRIAEYMARARRHPAATAAVLLVACAIAALAVRLLV